MFIRYICSPYLSSFALTLFVTCFRISKFLKENKRGCTQIMTKKCEYEIIYYEPRALLEGRLKFPRFENKEEWKGCQNLVGNGEVLRKEEI